MILKILLQMALHVAGLYGRFSILEFVSNKILHRLDLAIKIILTDTFHLLSSLNMYA